MSHLVESPIQVTRRGFLAKSLHQTAAAGALSAVACHSLAMAELPARGSFAGGERLGLLAFLNESTDSVGDLQGEGLAGRLTLDLASLEESTSRVPIDQFFIRTRKPSGLHYAERDPWMIRLRGLVRKPCDVKLADLRNDLEKKGDHLLECSGNGRQRAFGLLSTTDWSGIPVEALLERAGVLASATCVSIAGVDDHAVSLPNSPAGASWIFRLEEIKQYGSFLATEMGGQPLTEDHGQPVRLMTPGWYGCTCIKWVDQITLLDDTAPATGQMREFASRTHQDGVPDLAKDFQPATMDLAAMPVRVEKWRLGQEIVYRVVGIMWGGQTTTTKLMIRFNHEPPRPVDTYDHKTNATWTWWTHAWRPSQSGRYRIRLSVDDPNFRTLRLDHGFYDRSVAI